MDNKNNVEIATSIWSQKISGTRALIPYEGELHLLQEGSSLFLEARVTRPGSVTVRRPVSGDAKEEFNVSIIRCRYTVSNWTRNATHVAFRLHLEANYWGWFTLYNGLVSARLIPREELDQRIRAAMALARQFDETHGLEALTGESLDRAQVTA